jgi:hypothetical protein
MFPEVATWKAGPKGPLMLEFFGEFPFPAGYHDAR